jgi:PAS domain S-box-containing protein
LIKPFRLLLVLVGAIALAEAVIMVGLSEIHHLPLWGEILVDVVVLCGVSIPIAYRFFLLPLTEEVSVRVESEKMVRASEANHRTLINNIPGMVYSAGPDWSTRIISGSETLCGYSADDFSTKRVNWFDLMAAEDMPYVLEGSRLLHEKPCSLTQLYRITAANGSVRWMEDHKTSLFSADGRFQGVDGVVFDVTDREAAVGALVCYRDELELRVRDRTRELEAVNQELQRKNTELDEFAYMASHDLQEPLRKITSFADLLRRDIGGELNQRAETDLGYMVDAANRMRQLIEHLLLLSRAGSTPLKMEDVSMAACARLAVDALHTSIDKSRARITIEDLPMVNGDNTLLIQLYQNLLGNAIKYRSNDVPNIRCTWERAGNQVIFGVRDNGIGIAEEHLDKVFAPFKRLQGRSKCEGTGIGLAICRKIVERHGGRLWVESALDAGSHFKFTLGNEGSGPSKG